MFESLALRLLIKRLGAPSTRRASLIREDGSRQRTTAMRTVRTSPPCLNCTR